MSTLQLEPTNAFAIRFDIPGGSVALLQPEAPQALNLLPVVAVGSAPAYTHTQASPSDVWTINHNLGFRPAVELLDVGGREFDAEVLHTSPNQVLVYLSNPTAGLARLN